MPNSMTKSMGIVENIRRIDFVILPAAQSLKKPATVRG